MAFAMLLHRLATTAKIKGALDTLWGYHETLISRWTNHMMRWIYIHWGHMNNISLDRVSANVGTWSEAIARTLGLQEELFRCWGFVDGTFRKICRPPPDLQESAYNRYKRGHGLKWQFVVSPCGLIEDGYGPIAGRHHDTFLLAKSGINHTLQKVPKHPTTGREYYIYGDAGYRRMRYVMVGFGRDRSKLSADKATFCSLHNRARTAVEWAFGIITQCWQSLAVLENQRIGTSPIGIQYSVCTFLTNCRTCLYRKNRISLYFECMPPKLVEWLHKKPCGDRVRQPPLKCKR